MICPRVAGPSAVGLNDASSFRDQRRTRGKLGGGGSLRHTAIASHFDGTPSSTVATECRERRPVVVR